MYRDERAAAGMSCVIASVVTFPSSVLFLRVVCRARKNVLGEMVHRHAVENKQTNRNINTSRQAQRERHDLKQSHDE